MTRIRKKAAGLLRSARIWVAVIFGAVGCISDPCSPQYLGAIETAYLAEVVAACTKEKAPSLEECKAAEAIETKYALLREEWIKCSNN